MREDMEKVFDAAAERHGEARAMAIIYELHRRLMRSRKSIEANLKMITAHAPREDRLSKQPY